MSEQEFPCPPEPEKNACGGYYCSEQHGHIDCQCQPGLTMEGVHIEEIYNCHGQYYFKATSNIGSVFGSEVEGHIEAYGRTREQALEHLKQERAKLYESIWL